MERKPLVLCILDGFGIGNKKDKKFDAIAQASTPFLKKLLKNYPNSSLETSGEAVGLPQGQMGNSEVGHMTIGSGRVILQDLLRINKAIENDELSKHPHLKKLIKEHKSTGKNIHLLGLCSDGGVHSHISHMIYLIKLLGKNALSVKLHLFLDGRDVSPSSAQKYIGEIEQLIKEFPTISVSSISGRFYSMDRDNRQERTKLACLAIDGKSEQKFGKISNYISSQYEKKIYDEFIIPACHQEYQGIDSGDSVIFTNFRSDRARQLVEKILSSHSDLNFKLAMTHYSEGLSLKLDVLFKEQQIVNNLADLLSKNNKTQFRIAETEKYAHVTFFFNGGKEDAYINEDRIMIPSPNVDTYDLKPEMSAKEVTEKLTKAIESKKYDFLLVNFANCDMVGHSGNLKAAMKAVETIDNCLKSIHTAIDKVNGNLIITADHGNVECMFDVKNNSSHTSHTTNKVPFIIVGKDFYRKNNFVNDGNLADIAPTILELLNIEKPQEMTGKSLLKKYARLKSWLSFLGAIIIALAIRTVIFEPYTIPSGSMKPNFLVGDYLFVSKYPYGISNASFPFEPSLFKGRIGKLTTPKRGEVIVFKSDTNRAINYIKRLVGLPGDEIQMIQGRLYINGNIVPQKEAGIFVDSDGKEIKRYIETLPNGVSYYVLDETDFHPLDNTKAFKVPEGHYFFLGDNRDNSADSRTNGHPIGFVPYDKFIGRAEMIMFSNTEHLPYIWKWIINFRTDRFFTRVKPLEENN